MKVSELIKKLKEMNQYADVFLIEPIKGEYIRIVDCEEEYSTVVTFGLEEE